MPIGFFDSGVGGISVLREAIKLMPNEDFIYFGDSQNAPYGVKTVEEVKDLTNKAVEFLISKGAKAIAIACNTATSAAVRDLRNMYDMPIVGVEPALKPAVNLNNSGAIIIMATTMTLKEEKFSNLMDLYKNEAKIVPMPCPGLMEYVEAGNLDGEDLKGYLIDKFKDYDRKEIAAIVLGCTHYPFIREALESVVGKNIPILDGGIGTSKELRRRIEDMNLRREEERQGNIEIYNSLENEEILNLSWKLVNEKF